METLSTARTNFEPCPKKPAFTGKNLAIFSVATSVRGRSGTAPEGRTRLDEPSAGIFDVRSFIALIPLPRGGSATVARPGREAAALRPGTWRSPSGTDPRNGN